MKKCKLDKITLRYESYGDGRPLIALHGFSVDHRLMTGCLEPIFKKHKGWKRIYPDLPGMGQTHASNNLASSDQILDILLQFINKIIPNQHFVIAGESYGGYLARAIVQKKLELIDGLLLICPGIVMDYKKRTLPPATAIEKDQKFLASLSKENAAYFLDPNACHVTQTRRVWGKFKKEIMPAIKIGDQHFLKKLKEQNYSFSFDIDAVAKPFLKPSLLVTGRQDSVVGYHDAWALLEKYPRMTFAVLDKAGHNLQIEQEKIFASLVNEWLDRVN